MNRIGMTLLMFLGVVAGVVAETISVNPGETKTHHCHPIGEI